MALLGVNRESIKRAEDREEFKTLMQEIGEPIPSSVIATSMEECYEFVEKVGFPVIIRPAYTLGGTGGGIAENEEGAGAPLRQGNGKQRDRSDPARKIRCRLERNRV
ncbi:MAG: hypothetical protein V8R14_02200 [Clostridia bacterium]